MTKRWSWIGLSFMLMALCLPFPEISAEAGAAKQPAGASETQSQTDSPAGTAPVSKDKTMKKPDQKDVQSRGLFAKKKKKQVGGSAGHSQPHEQANSPMP